MGAPAVSFWTSTGLPKAALHARTPKARIWDRVEGGVLGLAGREASDVAGSVLRCKCSGSSAWMRSIFGVRAGTAAMAALVIS